MYVGLEHRIAGYLIFFLPLVSVALPVKERKKSLQQYGRLRLRLHLLSQRRK
jgi:hypothetical protein